MKKIMVIIITMIAIMSLTACSLGKEKELELTPENLEGTWVEKNNYDNGDKIISTYVINKDLTMMSNLVVEIGEDVSEYNVNFTYQIDGDNFTTCSEEDGQIRQYKVLLTNKRLTFDNWDPNELDTTYIKQ